LTKISQIKAKVKIIVQKRNLERMVIFNKLNKLIIQSLLLLNKTKKKTLRFIIYRKVIVVLEMLGLKMVISLLKIRVSCEIHQMECLQGNQI